MITRNMSSRAKSTEEERSKIPLGITDVNLVSKVRSTHGLEGSQGGSQSSLVRAPQRGPKSGVGGP